MKLISPNMLVALLALSAPAAFAQEQIVAPSPASSVSLDLYDQAGAAQAVRQINVSEAGLPLAVQARQSGFYKVNIGGTDYWVRSAKVRVSRDTTANCGAIAQSASALTAATPGAGKDACK